MSCHMSYIHIYKKHTMYHASYIIHYAISYITIYHMLWHIIYQDISYIIYHISYITIYHMLWHIIYQEISYIIYHISYIIYHISYVISHIIRRRSLACIIQPVSYGSFNCSLYMIIVSYLMLCASICDHVLTSHCTSIYMILHVPFHDGESDFWWVRTTRRASALKLVGLCSGERLWTRSTLFGTLTEWYGLKPFSVCCLRLDFFLSSLAMAPNFRFGAEHAAFMQIVATLHACPTLTK